MGQTLEKPAVEKRWEHGDGNGLRFAACGMQGWRLDMEDAHAAITTLGETFQDVSYYAVFDGHAGAYTSRIASEQLHQHILSVMATEGITSIPTEKDTDEMKHFCEVLSEAFISFDDMLKESDPYKSLRESCGSTALAVLVTSNYIIFCNCGDSRGFLARSSTVQFETKDHKPSDIIEKSRIENSGGCVVMDRVNGNLAVSRALGDFSFKERSDLPTREQAVSPEPTVTVIPRNHEQDQFVLLACDGIWDVMTCEEVRNFIHSKLLVTDNLESICSDLIDNCLLKDSRDNMTVLLVTFPGCPKVDELERQKDADLENNIGDKVREIIKSHEVTPSLFSVLNGISDGILLPECASSKLGIFSKVRYVENLLNNIDPKRDTTRDYTSLNTPPSFPISLQAFHQLASREQSQNSTMEVSSPTVEEDDVDMEPKEKLSHES